MIVVVPVDMKWHLTVVLVYIFLMTGDDQAFMYLLVVVFGEMSVRILCPSSALECTDVI